jgi:hypothetical protein
LNQAAMGNDVSPLGHLSWIQFLSIVSGSIKFV